MAGATSPDALLRRVEVRVGRRLDGLLQGDYRSLFYGYGVDFADLREYQPEDDIRYIDWNVTACMNEPFVKVFTEERELTVMLAVDLSGSLSFGTRRELKRELLGADLHRSVATHDHRPRFVVGAMGVIATQ